MTRDSTAAAGNDLGPFNWPAVAYDNWLPVPEDGHLMGEVWNGEYIPIYDPPIEGYTGPTPVQIELVDGPQHAQTFSFDPANNRFEYVAADGWSGEDYFTYKVVDGVDQFTQVGVSNIGKIVLNKPYMEVDTVLHNKPDGGHLAQDQKVNSGNTIAQGAFVPVHSSDYDVYTPAPAVGPGAATSALLPIVLRQFHPAPGTPAGWYSLGIPQNVAVWRTADRKGPVTGTSRFSAGQDTKLWVEGTATVVSGLTLLWSAYGIGAKVNSDSTKLTVFSWAGPRDVPGTSTYTYAASGALPGTDSYWVGGGTGSIMIGQNLEDPYPTTDKAQFKWDDGPIIGSAAYQAAPGYIWDMDVNVVRVDVTSPPVGRVFKIEPGVPRDNSYGPFLEVYDSQGNITEFIQAKGVTGQTTDVGPDNLPAGIRWSANVVLTGPTRDGKAGAGVDRIKVGFIQTLTSIKWRGTYDGGRVLIADIESKTQSGGLNDATDENKAPWYRDDSAPLNVGNSAFIGQRTTDAKGTYNAQAGSYQRTIQDGDGPSGPVPLTLEQDTDAALLAGHTKLNKVTSEWTFKLDVSAATTDTTVDTEKVYTQMATTNWGLDANGTVAWTISDGAVTNVVWTLTGGGYTPKPNDPKNVWLIEKGQPYMPEPWTNLNEALKHVKFGQQ